MNFIKIELFGCWALSGEIRKWIGYISDLIWTVKNLRYDLTAFTVDLDSKIPKSILNLNFERVQILQH